jgi:hypothetical protein
VKVEVKVEVMELALKRQRAESAASITMLKLFAPVFRLSGSPPSSRYHRHIAPHQPPAPASGSAIMLSQHVAVMKPPQRSHALPTAKDSARATAHSFFSPPVATGAASFFPSAPPPGAGDPPSFFSRTPPASRTPTRTPEAAPASPAPESVWERAGRVGNLDFDGGLADSLVGSAPIIDRKHKGATEKDDDYVATRISWRAGRGGENEVRTNPAPVALTPEFALRAA